MQHGLFRHHFLLASPGTMGSGFARSVILIAEHNSDGAMGLVVNKPVNLQVNDILRQLKLEPELALTQPVYWGGPVEPERGFVLHMHQGQWESTLPLPYGLAITTSKDILKAISQGQGPEQFMIMLGFSGWGGGQLETEFQNNAWLHTAIDTDIIFNTPASERWSSATRQLGIAPHQISHTAGHA